MPVSMRVHEPLELLAISGVAAYLSTKFLMKYFEKGNLIPFAYYCWGAGLFALILFATVFRNVVH